MSGFQATLREQVDDAQERMASAVLEDNTSQIHAHGARLMDLLDRANSHGIDTKGWVDNSVLRLAREVV